MDKKYDFLMILLFCIVIIVGRTININFTCSFIVSLFSFSIIFYSEQHLLPKQLSPPLLAPTIR